MVANARCVTTTDITLDAVLDGIGSGRWRTGVDAVRKASTAKTRRASKLKLPGIMFHGHFPGGRAREELKRYSGLLCLDIDHVDIEATREKVIADFHTMAAFISPSGTGIKAVLPMDNDDPAKHSALFDAVSLYYWRQLGISVDKACRDLARLCFVSHDPTIYINPKAQLFARCIDHTEHTDHTDITDHTCNERVTPHGVKAVIDATQPRTPGERHRCVFNLVRGLKHNAGMADASFSDLKPIVQQWFRRALPNITTKDFSETWADFVHAWPRADKELSGTTPLDAAFAKAMSAPLPAVCNQYDGEVVKTLLAVCWHLKGRDSHFYLSSHAAGTRLRIDPYQALRYLRMFEADGILEVVKKGNRNLATTYKWQRGTP